MDTVGRSWQAIGTRVVLFANVAGRSRYSTTIQELRTTMKNALIINETTKRILFLTLLSFLALC